MSLAYERAGVGGRPLFLLHGLASSGADFGGRLDGLAGLGWDVATPDLAGHGRSPRRTSYSVASLADDVLALADDLAWARFAVVGHELGGAVAQELALRAPGRLDGMVLQATAAGPFPLDRNLAEGGIELVRGAGMDSLARAYRILETGPMETHAARRLRLREPERGALVESWLRACDPTAYVALLVEVLDGADRTLLLADLRVPAIVLVGEEDDAFLDEARRLAAAIPGAPFAALPMAGHCPHAEAPEEWVIFVHGFLGSTVRTAV
ncbi:MAG TPA: alpha/beta fold hydrolase [Acidimicrobiales bacterium]|nr:alpha/beta fold hydrolase [Acidimicrobiales bacterium]